MKTLVPLILLIMAIGESFGACSSPAGVGGTITWNSGESKVKWCNGNSWVDPTISNLLSCAGNPGGMVNFSGGDLRYCDGSFWKSMKGTMLDSCLGFQGGTIQWDTTRYTLKFCDGAFWNLLYSASAPSVTVLGVNGGSTFTNRNIVTMNLQANVTDAGSNITHFCFKYSTAGAPGTPSASDNCWMAVNLPSPGVAPAPAISFGSYYYTIGFTPATYNIYGWVMTGAGLISSLTSSGNGTSGTDLASIAFDPGSPPELINVFSTNSNSSSIPPSSAEMAIPAGNDVFIKWKLTDAQGLMPNPVDIYYTTNESTFTLVASGLINGVNGACSVDGVNSTGCYRWIAGSPTSGYFKIRIQATDNANLSVIASASPNNMNTFKLIAGTTDPGLGGSAASAIIYPSQGAGGFNSGAGCFVVRDNGMMFLCDDRGLMMVDPTDGNYKVFLRYTGARALGPVASATLVGKPYKIALDYNDGLLIFDSDRILRVNLNTNVVSTLIGGGSTTADGTLATNFQVQALSGNFPGALFTPLPNGDLWFQIGADFYQTQPNTKVRIYRASDQKIYSLSFSGSGSLEDAGFNPTSYTIYNIGLSFNPITSAITKIRSRSIIPVSGGHIPRSISYNVTTGVSEAPHVPYLGYWTDDNTINSRNGEMYAVDRFQNQGIFKFNPGTNSWTRLLGTGTKGQCVDGTPALSCNVEVTDAYINSQNQIFFIDRNRIRTIDDSGNVLSLFGQSLAFGDGGFATSARIADVYYLVQTSGGKIAFIDNKEYVLREFTPDGLIQKLAGNGADAAPNASSAASAQPITANYWGGIYPMVADSSTGEIFYTRDGYRISKLDRNTGLWVDVAGGGGTSYVSADGLTSVSFDGYPMGPIGYSGTRLLRQFHQWNGTEYFQGYMKTFDVADGKQTAFAGVGTMAGSINDCPDGTVLTSCGTPPNHNYISVSHFDSANNRWLLHHIGSSTIRTATQGGNIGTLRNFPRGFQTFTYVLKAGVPHVYYCGNDGRVYRYNLVSSVETALAWPSSSINCQGHSMVWHAGRSSIVFSIKQNGLGAIAEIVDP